MMSEIEELCNKFIYIHNGEIKDYGNVSDLVKEYKFVHNYTWKNFKEQKAKDYELSKLKEQKNNTKNNKNKFDKIINKANNKGKNLPLINLLIKYYFKSIVQPFFLFGFPIIMLFIEGFVFKGKMLSNNLGDTEYSLLHNIIGSISITQIIATGIFVIPQTIIEFKNSVLLKRIGATNIKPLFFVLTVITIGTIFMVITFFWTLLWAGIMFGSSYGWKEIATPYQTPYALIFLLIILLGSISLGMLLSSLFKSTTDYVAVANILYLPIAFLGGSFLPIDFILSSDVLKYATYLNPFKYCMEPFNEAWAGKLTFDYKIFMCFVFNYNYIYNNYF
ncbi:ABC transporter ATP-binding protein [Spiroplasma gladiatoris]|uniref:ABC transporter ATP-binding protein n=2 Tax=Spiroplasma gladiatoris TaxID=2143 RepID=A0A4P7AH86_9MOLU|nr:ABC transporter ATP-binding protein [Spiroplasma gladiatoris]